MAYAGIGIVLLAAVLVLASTSYGAKLSLMGIQPSEVIKITFVFFMASLLCTKVDFRKVVLATIVAVIHVGILVLSRDLGSAVIFFVTYLVLIYVATRNPSYLFLGLGGGCVGSVIAYHLLDMSVSESVPGRIRWLSIKMKVIRSCSLCLRSEPEAGLEWDFVRALRRRFRS